MILRQLERIQRAEALDLIVVATSEDASDDELALTIADAGYDLVRGSSGRCLGSLHPSH
jgi:spore coat polysaccharide biosynthesis protein SpsF